LASNWREGDADVRDEGETVSAEVIRLSFTPPVLWLWVVAVIV